MKPEIIKADTAGRIVSWDNGNDVYYVGAACGKNDGVVYKDKKAFDEHIGICYIPEYGFFDEVGIDENVSDEMLAWIDEDHCGYVSDGAGGYTRDDIYAVVYDKFDGQLDYDKQVAKYGKPLVEQFIDHITEYTFQEVDWQCPGTFLNEFDFLENFLVFVDEYGEDKRLTPSQAKELGY